MTRPKTEPNIGGGPIQAQFDNGVCCIREKS